MNFIDWLLLCLILFTSIISSIAWVESARTDRRLKALREKIEERERELKRELDSN